MRLIMYGLFSRPKRKAFLCAVSLLALGLLWSASMSAARKDGCALSHQSSNVNAPHEGNALRFTRGSSGDLIQDGVDLGFTGYQASDGVSLIVTYNTFGDAKEASAFFEKEIAMADKVTKQGDKLDRAGKIIGKRAEILHSKHNEQVTAVLWTDGREFHEIQSTSLKDILEMEKVYKY